MLNLDKVKVYAVGGYVRDRLLNRDVNDHDYVVVGATHDDMVSAGFKKVGADFPVYLHPNTGDEYALARQERKVGNGYNGFETIHDTSVTLKDDLCRRDLTINSLAREVIGWNELGHAKLSDNIIDYFGGQEDLLHGVLRHVSNAFKDDPVRVLRIARFRARYGFSIAPETTQLMKQLVHEGELDFLTPERIWLELDKALMEEHLMLFFTTLMDCNALDKLFPYLDKSLIVIRRPLIKSVLRNQPKIHRYMILFSHMSKLRKDALLATLVAPREIDVITTKFKIIYDKLMENTELDPNSSITILEHINAYHDSNILNIIGNTLLMFNDRVNDKFDTLLKVYNATKNVSFSTLTEHEQTTLKGGAIKQAINDYKVIATRSIFYE